MENKNEPGNSQAAQEPTLEELLIKNDEAKSMDDLKELNKAIFARAKSAEEKLKENKGGAAAAAPAAAPAAASPAPTEDDDAPITTGELLALQGQGITDPTAITEIAKSAKKLGMSVSKAMADPIVSAGIKAHLRSTQGRNNTPPPSGPTGMIPDYSENEAYNNAKTPAERQKIVEAGSRKIFEQRVQGKGQGGDE